MHLAASERAQRSEKKHRVSLREKKEEAPRELEGVTEIGQPEGRNQIGY